MEADLPLTDSTMRLNNLMLRQISYQQLYQAVVAGVVPAARVDGRWRLASANLPGIAAHFAAIPNRRRKPSK